MEATREWHFDTFLHPMGLILAPFAAWETSATALTHEALGRATRRHVTELSA